MSDNKTYRVKANIQGEDHVDINLNLVQDVNVFEFLSLKMDTENLYRLHTANYGCVAGRVLANNSIGVPNVKISIFIAADEETKADSVLSYLYPYTSTASVNEDGIRYNLLSEEQLFVCHQNVGTFPSKRMVLDDSNVFEIFDKYYKFTTTTNQAGDYMIFGVPVGTQILHMDVDLSDIGDLLSQRPKDFIYKGYNVNQFENANMFKKDVNLGTLTQLMTQNESVDVKPFWGEVDEMGEVDSTGVRITRKDINLNYKFEPTCVFIGSLITDEKSNGFSKKCIPTERMGKMDRLTTGEGTIEMIRKMPDGGVEEFTIMGNQLIDGNGTWCYQIPMNLDYVMTDEYGNIVPTNDSKKGLPTRAQVRFRFSLNDFASDYQNNHLSKMLVPNNPQTQSELGDAYVFGTKTPPEEFRDLFWNKVYSVKSYIPRIQKGNWNNEKRFSGIKAVNVNVGNNPIPYNNMRIHITFMFVLQCAIMHTLIWIAGVVNRIISWLLSANVKCCGININLGKEIASNFNGGACITVGDGACPDLEGWYFAPKCKNEFMNGVNPLKETYDRLAEREGLDGSSTNDGNITYHNANPHLNGGSSSSYASRGSNRGSTSSSSERENGGFVDMMSTEEQNKVEGDAQVCVTNKIDYFMQCIEIALAQEYDVIQFDFYNDWINGMLYIPRWFANIKRKRKYLFGLIGPKVAKIQACMEGQVRLQRRYVQQCALGYKKDNYGKYTVVANPNGCAKSGQKCHKGKGRQKIKILKNTTPGGGLVHDQQTMKGQYVYYFRPCDWYEGKKVNYFATDIILLGSLSAHDMDGIPQAFKELSSSSYQMPTNLAATNMDTLAYMYGYSKDGTSICAGYVGDESNKAWEENTIKRLYDFIDLTERSEGNFDGERSLSNPNYRAYIMLLATLQSRMVGYFTDEQLAFIYRYLESFGTGVEASSGALMQVPQTFEAYKQWASKSDFKDDLENDPEEYEVTESAGIDWGYTGPGQGMYNKDHMYQPGGHFLGIACFNAESNVKSCVNLSRICEVGSVMSQRQAIVRRNGAEASFETDFIVPTGLISKDEIADTSFRSEFATLNHNGLKTRVNPITKRREYDFVSMIPVNFDGALSEKISGASEYNNIYGVQESSKSKAYTRTIEDSNIDYYDFRLGLHNGDTPESKYMTINGGIAYLPMYNNSYYFYFGLHDGSTALDRFYKEYFAECPVLHDGNAMIRVFVENADTCNNQPFGSATVYFAGISTRADNHLSYFVKSKTTDWTFYGEVIPDSTEVVIGGLEIGSYEITFSCEDLEDITYGFTVVDKIPEFIADIHIDIVDFEVQKYSTDLNGDREGRGYVVISWPDELAGQFEHIVISGSTYNPETDLERCEFEKNEKKYLPDGDAEYVISAIYCGGKTIELYRFTPYMPHEFDVLIGGSRQVTYNRTIKPLNDNVNWWKTVFQNGSSLDKFFVEKSLTYKESLFYRSSWGIEAEPRYGNPPYVVTVDGSGELLDGDTVRLSGGEADGYSLDYQNFYIPTRNNPDDIGYEVSGDKTDYKAIFKDMNGVDGCASVPASGELVLPSIYKPFFFRCLIFRNRTASTERDTYSLSIANGTLYENKFSKVSVCGQDIGHLTSGDKDWWNNSGANVDDYPILSAHDVMDDVPNGTYSVYIKENEPNNDSPVLPALEVSETIYFIGDGNKNPDTRVRYFMLYRSTESGTRQYINPNPQYAEDLRSQLQDKLFYDNGTSIVDSVNQDNLNIYWSGSCTKAFSIKLNDDGYLIFNPSNEIDRNAIFAGDVSVIPADNRKADCFVLGIFDPWTQLSDEEFMMAQNPNFGGKYSLVGRDTNMLTVMKLYTVEDFIKKVENPDMYDDVDPSGAETETVTYKRMTSFNVHVDVTAEETTAGGTSKYEQGTIEVSSFTVERDNAHHYLIQIPELYLNTYASQYCRMDIFGRFKLVNVDTGEQKMLRWFGKSIDSDGYAEFSGLIGTGTIHTIADDTDTRDLGYGGFKLFFDYDITIKYDYGVESEGYVYFNGGNIIVTKKTNG